MFVLERKDNSIRVRFSKEEVRVIHQAFNEVCHGYEVNDFRQVIGVEKEAAISEMQKLRSAYLNLKEGDENKSHIELSVTTDQLRVFINTLNEVDREMDHKWEFHSRMGTHKENVQELVSGLVKAVS